ncbi:hypothetical protein F0919_13795 [Taibaiella lutea]|uniref:Glycosyltransferase RgtA/B/C/D-like domain-containing protein n=1 Tax=Taibaiella lutea TaxID=2608001 RepID=A0A5M6CEX8_9BACT|nr:hypothetical protein [Taibaiella lutea]KAA5533607.1 hypothetical protein F0919_13795 [Taibaiella lutea]
MIPGFKNDLSVRITVFLLFVSLLIGSMYYYKERMMFCDAAHIFFDVVNNHHFQLSAVGRIGSFITQIFPLTASLFHLPFETVLLLYSISFNLFYLTVATILLFKFKNTKLAVLFALYFVLFVSDTYFWTNNEIHQAMGWCFLLFGIIQNYKQHPKHPLFHFTIVLILAFLSLFTHPLMLFIFPFLWLFTVQEKDLNPYNKRQILFLSLAFVIILGLKYYSMSNSGYDAGKIHSATHFSFLDLWHAFSSPMSKAISEKLIKDYFFVPVLFGLGLIAAVLKNKYKQIALVLLFAVPYYLAVCLTYSDFLTFYIESEWMPFSIITGILFVYYFVPMIDVKWIAVSLLVVFAVRINFIVCSAKKFEARNNWIFATVGKMKQEGIMKGYIYMNDSIQQMLLINWGGPVESMIASRLMGESPQRTFIVDTKEVIDQRLIPAKDTLIGPFAGISYKNLNAHYFIMDTVQQYQQVK